MFRFFVMDLAATRLIRFFGSAFVLMCLFFGLTVGANAQAVTDSCGKQLSDIKISGVCRLPPGTYFYGNINIVDGGELIFDEKTPGGSGKDITLWAGSIIIEKGGKLRAANDCSQQSGSSVTCKGRFGSDGATLKIVLYGKNESKWNPNKPGKVGGGFDQQNAGVPCKSDLAPGGSPCGIPQNIWDSQTEGKKVSFYGVTDYFYRYGPLYGDARCTDGKIWENGKCPGAGQVGYFGNKVLAVSFGGTLDLAGYKGASDGIDDKDNYTNSGVSWIRLEDGKDIAAEAGALNLEKAPGDKWKANDEIVVTTTDYLPGHSEKRVISSAFDGKNTVPVTQKLSFPHNGTRYGGQKDSNKWNATFPDRLKENPGMDPKLILNGAETRAAVALLTRSIQIVSGGDSLGDSFPDEKAAAPCENVSDPGPCHYHYGAHMVIRQGAAEVKISGVEFKQMGQGGRLGHYPIHFHMARATPPGAFVKDSSVNESMTRWVVLHATQGVLLARNVGYKSIGHGFYLESGSEAENRLFSNIGIFARAAVKNAQNPRNIPGILADNTDPSVFKGDDTKNQGMPYRSDSEHPTIFWITNGWNDFIGNMGAGAGTCGAAYWFVPTANSDMVEDPTGNASMGMKWSGYAGLQKSSEYAGATPLKTFYKNYATSAMHSFQTTSDSPECNDVGVFAANAAPEKAPGTFGAFLQAAKSISPAPVRKPKLDGKGTEPDNYKDMYYPHILNGARHATICPNGDCSTVPVCSNPPPILPLTPLRPKAPPANASNPQQQCAVTVLDHFTSSFHWAQGNVSAIWLRPQWYLLDNSVLTDVQNGGLSFVTGGDYTHASIIQGYWGLVRNSVFVGNTTSDRAKFPYSGNTGPFTGAALKCGGNGGVPQYCLNSAEGVSMPVGGFFTNQRLANIYDGPSYQDSIAYLDIHKAPCSVKGLNSDCMYGSGVPLLLLRDVPKAADPNNEKCYVPNAAIAWKQPNGFFYPPAFHTANLFFQNVDLRHYVIDPLFKSPVSGRLDFGQGGTYYTDSAATKEQYCTGSTDMFTGWTSIDRQTELNDDDGSLTGLSNSYDTAGPLKQTISINEDQFFGAPVDTPECASSVGGNSAPGNACTKPKDSLPPATARTSPYDYVATAIYTDTKGDNPPWSTNCNNQSCYGVPLYRQYLTGAKEAANPTREWRKWFENDCEGKDQSGKLKAQNDRCRWPFIRMAGSGIGQRETLTINNGLYYLDTTVSQKTQFDENFAPPIPNPPPNTPLRLVNVFEKEKTYNVFFLYAKKTTVQTYQIYVGTKFQKTDVKPIYVNIDSAPLTLSRTQPPSDASWLVVDDTKVAGDGIVSVTVNFKGLTALDPTPSELCKPSTFCHPVNGQCKSSLSSDDLAVSVSPTLKTEADIVCEKWAVKDLDCPSVGCPGFSFKLASDFQTGGYHRPEPELFPEGAVKQVLPQGAPGWTVKFSNTATYPDDTDGTCHYPELPGSDCKIPDALR